MEGLAPPRVSMPGAMSLPVVMVVPIAGAAEPPAGPIFGKNLSSCPQRTWPKLKAASGRWAAWTAWGPMGALGGLKGPDVANLYGRWVLCHKQAWSPAGSNASCGHKTL